MSSLSETSSLTTAVTLPAAAEHEWRFSYQFASSPPKLVMHMAIGGGILALMIVAVKAAW